VRGKLAVRDGLGRRWRIPYLLINIDTHADHQDRYDNRNHSPRLYVRRLLGMVELLQIAHMYLPGFLALRPSVYGVSIVKGRVIH
jgi:hypothetical protein